MSANKRFAMLLVAVTSLVATLGAASDIDVDVYRLPSRVVPVHYELELDVTRNDQFSGLLSIEIQVTGRKSSARRLKNLLTACIKDANSCERNRQIVLHAGKNINVESAEVYKLSSNKKVDVVSRTYDPDTQFLVLHLNNEIESGTSALVKFRFSSRYSSNLRGLYTRNYVQDDGERVRYVASSFQPTFARTVFPCFDEPQMKASFRLKLKHQPEEIALSNMPANEADPKAPGSTLFETTPKMSVHMVGVVVGQLEHIEQRTFTRTDMKLRAYAPKFKSQYARFAVECAADSLIQMEEYTDFAFPLKKMDIVALPDRELDNTEHWGMAIIRSNVTLIEDETVTALKLTSAVNVAHIVAHQWFANLITTDWWDSTWVTEGVAAMQAFEIVQNIYPDNHFNSKELVRLATLSGVLKQDSHVVNGLSPLSPALSELMTSDQINKIFTVVEFMKSASLYKLIEDVINYETLRDALRTLVKKHAYGNVNGNDLAEAIKKSTGKKNYLDNLTTQLYNSSWPIVSIDSPDNKTISLELQRLKPKLLALYGSFYCLSGMIHYHDIFRVDDGIGMTPVWFNMSVPAHFFILNREKEISTYYRVKYSDVLIESNFKYPVRMRLINPLARLALVDDATALVQAGELEPESLGKWLNIFRYETNSAVILALLVASRVYSEMKMGESPAKEALVNVYTRYGFNELEEANIVNMRAQTAVLSALIAAGDEPVIQDALATFDRYDGLVPQLNLREPIYLAVVSHGTEKQAQKLIQHLAQTKTYEEKVRLVTALTKTKSREILLATLDQLVKISLPADTKRELYNAMKNTEFADDIGYVKPEDLEP